MCSAIYISIHVLCDNISEVSKLAAPYMKNTLNLYERLSGNRFLHMNSEKELNSQIDKKKSYLAFLAPTDRLD